ncbi:unnamed protein product, partial [Hymenolepis diminuta]
MALKKISRLLKNSSIRQHVVTLRRKFIEVLIKCMDSEDDQSDVYRKSVYILKRFIRLPRLGLSDRELDLFLKKFRSFDGSPKAITLIASICNVLIEDQRTHRGSSHQCKIIRAALNFLQLNFTDSNTIHKSIGNLIDIVWTNMKIADLKSRTAYISGHFQLLTRRFRPIITHTINRLRREIILP